MEFHSPLHHRHSPLVRSDENQLWRPGSPAYIASASQSPGREQMDHTHMDRLRCKQDLQKLYEDTSESSYDLSLKDIVDPCYSISGNLKAVVAQEELQSQVPNKRRSWRRSSIPKLSFSFSFPGLRGKSARNERPSLSAWETSSGYNEEKSSSSSTPPHVKASLCSSKHPKNGLEASASSMAKIHPSNQCSSCYSYTIFFKNRCLVCGRLYCSMCTKEYMHNLSTGFRCKAPCKYGPFRKRLSQKIANRCWPF